MKNTDTNLTLLILAAGLGKRFGGLKQLYKFGKENKILLDYSLEHAIENGFNNIVIVIRKEIEEDFLIKREEWLKKYKNKINNIEFAFQETQKILDQYNIKVKREKPLGTGHAILCARHKITTPFAIINSDDYYGEEAYKLISEFLKKDISQNFYCLIGYRLKNTLSKYGHVSRGVCKIDKEYNLLEILEYTKIYYDEKTKVFYNNNQICKNLTPDTLVSMNLFGLHPSIFNYIEEEFQKFIEKNKNNLKEIEFYLPTIINNGIKDRKFKVKLIPTNSQWIGITYKEDIKDLKNLLT